MTSVTMVVAPSIARAIEAALSDCVDLGPVRSLPPVVVAAATTDAASPHGAGRFVVEFFERHASDAKLVVPPQPVVSVLSQVARRKSGLTRVDIRPRAERITSVWLPAHIVSAKTLVAVNDVRQDLAVRPALAIGLWSQFAGLWERIGVRLAKPDEGLAAEIALAVRPALILLVDSWRGLPVVISTSDQIAAELVGLAVRQARRAGEDDLIGPWQDPLVQRATELDLGVRSPEQLAIRMVIEGTNGSNDAATLGEDVAARLGVRDFAVTRG